MKDAGPGATEGVDSEVVTTPEPAASTTEPNAVGTAIDILGDEWTLLILRHAQVGVTRFGEFKAALGISDAVLTSRLRKLTEAGLLESRVYQETPLRAEYVLTPTGAATWPLLVSIWDWERRWVPGQADRLPLMVHRECGHEFNPVLSCRACEQPVPYDSISASWGPAGGWERSTPSPTASPTRRRSDDDRDEDAGEFPETMRILANRWSVSIIVAAFLGITRFSDFRDRVGVPPSLLTQRLRSFTEAGVLDAVPDPQRHGWFDYRLTAKGLGFLPVVMMAAEWAQRWFPDPAGRVTASIHLRCGEPLIPRLRCSQCDVELDVASIEARPSGTPGSGSDADA